jgi:hypothetical protein
MFEQCKWSGFPSTQNAASSIRLARRNRSYVALLKIAWAIAAGSAGPVIDLAITMKHSTCSYLYQSSYTNITSSLIEKFMQLHLFESDACTKTPRHVNRAWHQLSTLNSTPKASKGRAVGVMLRWNFPMGNTREYEHLNGWRRGWRCVALEFETLGSRLTFLNRIATKLRDRSNWVVAISSGATVPLQLTTTSILCGAVQLFPRRFAWLSGSFGTSWSSQEHNPNTWWNQTNT